MGRDDNLLPPCENKSASFLHLLSAQHVLLVKEKGIQKSEELHPFHQYETKKMSIVYKQGTRGAY